MRDLTVAMTLLACSGLLNGCQDSQPATSDNELPELVTKLIEKARSNLVFIEGGTFTMGDFGAVGEDGVWRPYFPPTIEEDQPHAVTLSSYSLSAQKTTWGEFDTYLLANGLEVFERNFGDTWERQPYQQEVTSQFYINKPATVTWEEAKSYCQWLGNETGLSLDVPTSAQWEFAARNRGSKEWIYSTHDGQPLSAHPDLSELVRETGEYVPVGSRLPANPLGVYDMADNGKEWVNDWFSETWYKDNPQITDPQGPNEGAKKVIRNLDFSFSRVGASESLPSSFNEDWVIIVTNTFRCALHSPTPARDSSQ